MNTRQVRVQVSVMVTVDNDKDTLEQVQYALDTANSIVSASELETDPKILTSDLSNADIYED